jgi:hypothetical protein
MKWAGLVTGREGVERAVEQRQQWQPLSQLAVTIRGWLKSPREQLGRNEGSRGGGDHEGQREGKRGQKTKAENTKEPEKRNCSPRHWKSSRSYQGLRIPTP